MDSDRINSDRAEGSRGNVGVNPSAIHFSTAFKPLADPPEPMKLCDLRKHAEAHGFADGNTSQAEYILNRISYQHASGYFKLLSLMRRLSGTSSPYISAVGKDGTKTVISDS